MGGVVLIALVPALIGSVATASLADTLAHGYEPVMISTVWAVLITAIFVG